MEGCQAEGTTLHLSEVWGFLNSIPHSICMHLEQS